MRFVQLDRPLACLVLALFTSPAFGQMVWKKASPKVSPPARVMHAMTFDSARQRTVLFGGFEAGFGNLSLLGDTWEYDGTTWVQRKPSTSPPPRKFHTMSYDSVRRRVVLFGGTDGKRLFNDTWEFDGTNWRRRQPALSPPPLGSHASVYDSVRRVTIVFGGSYTSTDVWEWDGTNWRRRSLASTPKPRWQHGMVFDRARGVVVLWGGVTGNARQTSNLNDTWE
jgi:hypothetical protein